MQINKRPNQDSELELMAIFFFDGVCGFCNGMVDFTLRHDRMAKIRFSALQSETTQCFFRERGLVQPGMSTAILWSGGQLYQKSDVLFMILRQLGFPWRIFAVFQLFPRFLRDWAYDQIANHRYRIFGKRETCRVPTAEERARFL